MESVEKTASVESGVSESANATGLSGPDGEGVSENGMVCVQANEDIV